MNTMKIEQQDLEMCRKEMLFIEKHEKKLNSRNPAAIDLFLLNPDLQIDDEEVLRRFCRGLTLTNLYLIAGDLKVSESYPNFTRMGLTKQRELVF
mmetsp:Transcript_13844/g.21591  ORF Transcript_13844/g.21591 Transcript_13844/m.21591 type:complete len:95 (+) Transcript_13844:884-1168(+)